MPPRPAKHIEHLRPLFPSVSRLLQEHDIPDLEKIKGTGVRGMLTKGDVLAYLGKASSPTGTFKEAEKTAEAPKKVEAEVRAPRLYDRIFVQAYCAAFGRWCDPPTYRRQLLPIVSQSEGIGRSVLCRLVASSCIY